MLAIFLGAGILGIIIAIMEEGDFPGWGTMFLCALAALLPAALVQVFLPPELSYFGPLAGAVCAGFAISALCGMTVKRATFAAGLYLIIQIGIFFVFQKMMS